MHSWAQQGEDANLWKAPTGFPGRAQAGLRPEGRQPAATEPLTTLRAWFCPPRPCLLNEGPEEGVASEEAFTVQAEAGEILVGAAAFQASPSLEVAGSVSVKQTRKM